MPDIPEAAKRISAAALAAPAVFVKYHPYVWLASSANRVLTRRSLTDLPEEAVPLAIVSKQAGAQGDEPPPVPQTEIVTPDGTLTLDMRFNEPLCVVYKTADGNPMLGLTGFEATMETLVALVRRVSDAYDGRLITITGQARGGAYGIALSRSKEVGDKIAGGHVFNPSAGFVPVSCLDGASRAVHGDPNASWVPLRDEVSYGYARVVGALSGGATFKVYAHHIFGDHHSSSQTSTGTVEVRSYYKHPGAKDRHSIDNFLLPLTGADGAPGGAASPIGTDESQELLVRS